MSCIDKSTTFDLLALRKTPYLDSLRASIPKLPGGVAEEPQIDLPRWRCRPLESKMPLIPDLPEPSANDLELRVPLLARRKLGEPLRIDPHQFDTSDPYNYEVRLPYEALHDPHLARFFHETAHLRDDIIKMGLLTPRLDVKCSLREYNVYRNYLRLVQGKLIRKELERRDEMHREQLMLDISERQASKINEKLKKDEIRNELLRELQLKEESKLRAIRRKQTEIDERIDALSQARRQSSQRKKIESALKRENFRKKRAAMAKREQQRVLNTLNEWHERDRRLEKALEQNSTRRRNAKVAGALNRFERKKTLQEESLEREKFLKECAEKLKRSFMEAYEEKLSKSRYELQELLIQKKKALQKPRKAKKKAKRKYTCHC